MWDSERDFQLWEEIAREVHSRHSRKSGLYVSLLTRAERHAHTFVAERARGSKRVLEIGVGGGEHLVYRHADTGTESYVGVDLSPAYAEICRHKFGIEVECANATALPFADAAFDCVIAMAILEHVNDLEKVMAEVDRVLAPGGLFLATIPTNGSFAVSLFKALVTYPTMRWRGIRRPDLVWHHLNVNCFKRVQSVLLQRFPSAKQISVPFRWLPWRFSPLWVFVATKK